MLRLLIAGICGKMGETVRVLAKERGAEIVCGVDSDKKDAGVPVYSAFGDVAESVDAVIDFSSPGALRGELEWAKNKKIPVVLAVTGYSEEDFRYIDGCAKEIAVLQSSNFSAGINLLKKLAAEAAEAFGGGCDIEIIEKHHKMKADAPSGTALALADSINGVWGGGRKYVFGRNGNCPRGGEIGIHAVRGGNIAGEHEIIFAFGDEVLTLSHSALSKKAFACGALSAAEWIIGKPCGRYGADDLFG